MNLFFSLVLFTKLYSRELFIISYLPGMSQKTEIAKKLLTENHGIPVEEIHLRESPNPCKRDRNSILQICIDKEGHYEIVQRRTEVLKKSFKVFKM